MILVNKRHEKNACAINVNIEKEIEFHIVATNAGDMNKETKRKQLTIFKVKFALSITHLLFNSTFAFPQPLFKFFL